MYKITCFTIIILVVYYFIYYNISIKYKNKISHVIFSLPVKKYRKSITKKNL